MATQPLATPSSNMFHEASVGTRGIQHLNRVRVTLRCRHLVAQPLLHVCLVRVRAIMYRVHVAVRLLYSTPPVPIGTTHARAEDFHLSPFASCPRPSARAPRPAITGPGSGWRPALGQPSSRSITHDTIAPWIDPRLAALH